MPPRPGQPRSRSSRAPWRAGPAGVVPGAVVVAGAVVLCWYAVAQWRALAAPSWDLAIFTELAKAYAHLEAPVVPVKGEGYNLLGDHFHPLLVLLAVPYWVHPSGLSLLVAQALLLAVSAWPVTRLAVRLVGPVAGGALGLAYVLSWGFQGAVESQFHEVALAVPLLAWSGAAFVERRWGACVAWALPLVLVKEDLGLTVLMVGAALWLRGRYPGKGYREDERARRLGATVAVLGVAAFLVTVLVLLPALNPDGVWAYGLSGSGGDGEPQGLLDQLLQEPALKAATVLVLVAATGVVGLTSPWALLALPTLAWRFLGSVTFYWDWQHWHYNAVLVPVAFCALLDALARLRGGALDAGALRPWRSVPLRLRALAAAGTAVPVVAALLTAPHLPLWVMTTDGFGQESPRAAAAQQVLDAVPEGATVAADLTLLARLVPQATVYWVGTGPGDTDYVVVDTRGAGWSSTPDAESFGESSSPSGATYTTVLEVDGFEVARRDS